MISAGDGTVMDVKGAIGIMIGMPAAGKSTYTAALSAASKQFEKYLNRERVYKEVVLHVITFDDTITLDATQGNKSWKNLRTDMHHSVEQFISSFLSDRQTSEKFLFLLLDDNMFYKSMRRIYYSLANKYQFAYWQIFIDTRELGVEQLIQRDKNRNNPVGEETIRKMEILLERPDTKNEWEQCTYTLHNTEYMNEPMLIPDELFECFTRAISIAQGKIDNNAEEKSKWQSNAHLLDVQLRRTVSEFMNSVRNSSSFLNMQPHEQKRYLRELGSYLNEEKKKINSVHYDDIDSVITHFLEKAHSFHAAT